MKEKENLQPNNNGPSKAILFAIGLILLLSACGNVTKMVFGPVVREVAREVENEVNQDVFQELEREIDQEVFQELERELKNMEKELEAADRDVDNIEVKINDEIIEDMKVEIEIGR